MVQKSKKWLYQLENKREKTSCFHPQKKTGRFFLFPKPGTFRPGSGCGGSTGWSLRSSAGGTTTRPRHSRTAQWSWGHSLCPTELVPWRDKTVIDFFDPRKPWKKNAMNMSQGFSFLIPKSCNNQMYNDVPILLTSLKNMFIHFIPFLCRLSTIKPTDPSAAQGPVPSWSSNEPWTCDPAGRKPKRTCKPWGDRKRMEKAPNFWKPIV